MKVNPGYVNHLMISVPEERLNEFVYVKGKNKGKINFDKLRDFFYRAAE
jgi:hypothetical protein